MTNDRTILILGVVLVALAGGLAGWWLSQASPPVLPTPSDSAPPTPAAEATASEREPATTVVWISLDGLRADYLDRTETPFLARLASEGAVSRALVPAFPSLTFPSHVTQATGVGVNRHGIPTNSFHDKATGQTLNYPGDNALLEAEGIWTTAARQGLRVAVTDWTLSHNQQGEVRSAYYDPAFQNRLSDTERLQRLLGIYRDDHDATPLRLLMGYASGLDGTGHSRGPDAPEVADALRKIDRELGEFLEAFLAAWQERKVDGDQLYLILTTDHGMTAVETMVDLAALAGVAGQDDVVLVSSGNIGHIYLPGETPEAERIASIVAHVQEHGGDWAPVYARADLPPAWEFDHPTRVGDVVVVLEPGYAFAGRGLGNDADSRPRMTAPVMEVGGPLGMHGYDPATCPDMLGAALFWRYPEPLGGVDLGRVDSHQLHATVCRLLGIEPAAGAHTDAVILDAPTAATSSGG
jgi:hypothetical protein